MTVRRAALLAYGFFYEQIIDDLPMKEPLIYLSSFAQAYKNNSKSPEIPADSLYIFCRPLLNYLLSELRNFVDEDQEDDLYNFLAKIDDRGRYFYEGKYMPDSGEWDSEEDFEKRIIADEFQTLIRSFFIFADHIGKAKTFIDSLTSLKPFIRKVVVSSDKIPIDPEMRSMSRKILEGIDWGKEGIYTSDQSMRLLALARSFEMEAHYACEGDPFLARGISYTTTTVKYPSVIGLSFKDLLNIRRTREWSNMIKLFDAHHSKPDDRHLALDFRSSLEGMNRILGTHKASALIGSALSLGSTIPVIGSLISVAQSMKDFFEYLKLRKTVAVTHVDEVEADSSTQRKVYVNYQQIPLQIELSSVVSISSAHDHTSIDKAKLRRLAREGQITGYKRNGRWLISEEALTEYCHKHNIVCKETNVKKQA